ncbi:021c1235-e99d-4984-bada-a2a7f9b88199 [Thermothielavioides terrestris]|uniref:021c1235-e99d-4984-bada-a2a7f9b88199 n=1 Tax=Thermothielavioides terrestris TaxID=2587410 RepID=A0A446BTT7_9PEZI|nr:021c1235-e99d-4984-bada-a2a7f9b88199 [Thermothielavioides terrestris]
MVFNFPTASLAFRNDEDAAAADLGVRNWRIWLCLERKHSPEVTEIAVDGARRNLMAAAYR